MPEVYEEFASIAQELENHYKDMQDMEFTIEMVSYSFFKQEMVKEQQVLLLKLLLI